MYYLQLAPISTIPRKFAFLSPIALCLDYYGCAVHSTSNMNNHVHNFQTGGSRSLVLVTKKLWSEEGISMFTKGLTARALSMSTSSFLIILGYETVKRLSYKNRTEGLNQISSY